MQIGHKFIFYWLEQKPRLTIALAMAWTHRPIPVSPTNSWPNVQESLTQTIISTINWLPLLSVCVCVCMCVCWQWTFGIMCIMILHTFGCLAKISLHSAFWDETEFVCLCWSRNWLDNAPL